MIRGAVKCQRISAQLAYCSADVAIESNFIVTRDKRPPIFGRENRDDTEDWCKTLAYPETNICVDANFLQEGYRPLRGLVLVVCLFLGFARCARFTPGFMLPSASRTLVVIHF